MDRWIDRYSITVYISSYISYHRTDIVMKRWLYQSVLVSFSVSWSFLPHFCVQTQSFLLALSLLAGCCLINSLCSVCYWCTQIFNKLFKDTDLCCSGYCPLLCNFQGCLPWRFSHSSRCAAFQGWLRWWPLKTGWNIWCTQTKGNYFKQ